MDRIHYSLNGVANKQMKTAVKNALEKVSGVQMVNVDMARSTIEVGFNAPADENQIKSCISDTGLKIE